MISIIVINYVTIDSSEISQDLKRASIAYKLTGRNSVRKVNWALSLFIFWNIEPAKYV